MSVNSWAEHRQEGRERGSLTSFLQFKTCLINLLLCSQIIVKGEP